MGYSNIKIKSGNKDPLGNNLTIDQDLDDRYTQLLYATLNNSSPIGSIMFYARSTPPTGWLECDGRWLEKSQYNDLWVIIGNYFLNGDVASPTQFKLPDLRGKFVRSWDHNAGFDSNRVFGSYQDDSIQNMTGNIGYFTNDSAITSISGVFAKTPINLPSPANIFNSTGFKITFDSSRSVKASTETRPKNITLLPCIKATATAFTTMYYNANNLSTSASYATEAGSASYAAQSNYALISSSSETSSLVTKTIDVGSKNDLVVGYMASNDYFKISAGGNSDSGYLEIATGDNGSEPIYIRQYNTSGLLRTATLLDENGNTTFPGTLTISPSNISGTQYGINLYDAGSGASEGLSIKWDSLNRQDLAKITGFGDSSGGILTFSTNSNDTGVSQERLRITSSGYVGIGTVPSYKLHVKSNGETFAIEGTDHAYIGYYPYGLSSGRKGYVGFPTATTDSFIINNETTTGKISFVTSGYERLNINSSGYVGIGTDSPTAPLHILKNGDVTLNLQTYTSSLANATIYLGYAKEAFYGHQIVATNTPNNTYSGKLNFQYGNGTSFVTSMSLDNSGKVGIGTNSPTAPLHIHGFGSFAYNQWTRGIKLRDASVLYWDKKDGGNYYWSIGQTSDCLYFGKSTSEEGGDGVQHYPLVIKGDSSVEVNGKPVETITRQITSINGLVCSSTYGENYKYADIYRPDSTYMYNNAKVIVSINTIEFNGNVDENDTLTCFYSIKSDRIRVFCQNSEQRSNAKVNVLIIWEK